MRLLTVVAALVWHTRSTTLIANASSAPLYCPPRSSHSRCSSLVVALYVSACASMSFHHSNEQLAVMINALPLMREEHLSALLTPVQRQLGISRATFVSAPSIDVRRCPLAAVPDAVAAMLIGSWLEDADAVAWRSAVGAHCCSCRCALSVAA